MRRHFLIALGVILGNALLIGMSWASSGDRSESSADKSTQTASENSEHVIHQAYLGIAIEPISPDLQKELSRQFRKGRESW